MARAARNRASSRLECSNPTTSITRVIQHSVHPTRTRSILRNSYLLTARLRARLNARVFRNEFKNCRIFLVARGDSSLLVVYVPSETEGTSVHWPPVRFCKTVYASRYKKRKGFSLRRKEREREKESERKRKRERQQKKRDECYERGKKVWREGEFGSHYSPAVMTKKRRSI